MTRRSWNLNWILLCGFCGWFGIALLAMQFAQLNFDEPWYLTACYLVMQGLIPYRDFVYAQTPFLPYAYGVFTELATDNLYVGRFGSVWFSTIALAFVVSIARRTGGFVASVLTLVAIILSPGALYFLVIVKTYALTSALIGCSLYFAFRDRLATHWLNPLLSTVAVGLAATTRITMALCVLIVLIYWRLNGRGKESAVGIAGVLLGVSIIVLPSIENFIFDTISFHLQRGTVPSAFYHMSKSDSLIGMLLAFEPVLFLSFMVLALALRSALFRARLQLWWKSETPEKLLWIGIISSLFLINFFAPANVWEYQTSTFMLLVPLLASVTATIDNAKSKGATSLLYCLLLGLVTLPAWPLQAEYFWSSKNTIQEAAQERAALSQLGSPGDQVLGVYNHLALGNGLGVFHGNEMGLFSISAELSETEARKRRLLTVTQVTELLDKREPEFVIIPRDGVLFHLSVPSTRVIEPSLQAKWQGLIKANYIEAYHDASISIFQRIK